MNKNKKTILIGVWLVLAGFTANCLFPLGLLAATSQSAHYQVDGGQIDSLGGTPSSTNYNSQAGGQGIGGLMSSPSYSVQQGSAFSQAAATTTSTSTPTPTPTPTSGSGGLVIDTTKPQLASLTVGLVTSNSAVIHLVSDKLTLAKITYVVNGQTYTTAPEISFSFSHDLTLDHLAANQQYTFSVELQDVAGNKIVFNNYSFQTSVSGVPNVSALQTQAVAGGLNLRWSNPPAGGLNIIIVKRTDRYPVSPTDGEVIFSGLAQNFIDPQVKAGQRYYYAIFVQQPDGQLSSGALISKLFGSATQPVTPGLPVIEQPGGVIPAQPIPVPAGLQPTPLNEESSLSQPASVVVTGLMGDQQIKSFLSNLTNQVSAVMQSFLVQLAKTRVYLAQALFKYQQRVIARTINQPGATKIFSWLNRAHSLIFRGAPQSIFLAKTEQTVSTNQNLVQNYLINQVATLDNLVINRLTNFVVSNFELALSTLNKNQLAFNTFYSSAVKVQTFLAQAENNFSRWNNKITLVVYQTFSSIQRQEVKQVTGAQAVVAKVLPAQLTNNPGASWQLVANSETLISLPNSVFKKPVELISLTITDKAYILKYNKTTDQYEAIINAPEVKGTYQVNLQVIYQDHTYEEVHKTALVDPSGVVYTYIRQPWSWSKPWQIFLTHKQLISAATVNLYTKNQTGEWVLWPANLYQQVNPQLTNNSGSFAFLVPAGQYYLTVQASGFTTYQSSILVVSDKIINLSINLHHPFSLGLLWITMCVIIIALGLGLYLTLFSKNKKYNL